ASPARRTRRAEARIRPRWSVAAISPPGTRPSGGGAVVLRIEVSRALLQSTRLGVGLRRCLEVFTDGLEVAVAGAAAHLAGDDPADPRGDQLDVDGLAERAGGAQPWLQDGCSSSRTTPSAANNSLIQVRTRCRISDGPWLTMPESIASTYPGS